MGKGGEEKGHSFGHSTCAAATAHERVTTSAPLYGVTSAVPKLSIDMGAEVS